MSDHDFDMDLYWSRVYSYISISGISLASS